MVSISRDEILAKAKSEETQSLRGFLLGSGAVLGISFSQYIPRSFGVPLLASASFLLVENLLEAKKSRFNAVTNITSLSLGCVFGGGLSLLYNDTTPIRFFGGYAASLAFFHFSEFYLTAKYNGDTVSFDSFLLNHSREYAIAALVSWVEYFVELYFFPQLKSHVWISLLGLSVAVGGEVIRKIAMCTSTSNFTHIVADTKRETHELVTHGIYSYSRHPAYMGWFYWSVGTQLLLSNPLCVVAYALASYQFFKERVEYEEANLCKFFPGEYQAYQRRVGTGIPFVKGYRV